MDNFLHPFLIHFPVALLISSLVSYVSSLFYKPDFLRELGLWLLCAGGVGGVIALISGDLAGGEIPRTIAIHEAALLHERAAWITVWLFAMLILWVFLRKDQMKPLEFKSFVFLHLIGVGVLLFTAKHGGELVRDYGVGVKPAKHIILKQKQVEQDSIRKLRTP